MSAPAYTADSITLMHLVELEDSLAIAAAAARKVRLQSMAGDISPEDAAAEINSILAQIAKP